MIVWSSIVILLVISFLGLSRLGIYFSSDLLFQLVKKETNGYYQLTFEKVDIDLLKKTIKLKKVRLKPDPNQDYQEKGLNNLYELEMKGLNIDLKSIISIYTIRQLIIKNIRIIDPQIHIIRKKGSPDESFSLQTGNLYKEISDYLRVLQIDVLAIENAAVRHFPSELGLGNIDFLISNLLIDSASRPDKRFYSENIELEIHNQSFRLKDSIHQISFDRFLLSTADSILTFQNLVLKPVSDVQDTYEGMDKTIYDITIPTLRLKGVDYFSAYRYNHLEMEELSLTDSYIFLEEQTQNQTNQPEKKGNLLLEPLMSVFDEVNIGKMRFINAHLNLKTNSDYNNNYQHVQSERADIVLYNFLLDSSNYQFNLRNKYFDDVDINIKDYRSYLPDSIHTIHFDLLKLSSIDSSLIFKNFNISNNGKGNNTEMFLSIDLPLIHLKGLNYLDILLHKQLLIKEMLLQHPNIVFEMKHDKLRQLDFTPDSLYMMIMDQFELVGIKKLQIQQGTFSINKTLNIERADLSAFNFNIPFESNSWFDILDTVDLEMYNMVLDDENLKLKANHLKLDPLTKKLIVGDFQMDYKNHHVSASGDLSNLLISGIDLDRMSTGNLLVFDTISIINPRFNVEVLQPVVNRLAYDNTKSIFIEVVNGQLATKTYDSIMFSLDKMNTDLTLGSVNNIQFGEADSLSITLLKVSKKLNINKIKLFDSHTLFLEAISIQQIKDTLLQGIELNGTIPEITIHGVDQSMFWEHDKLAGDSLIVQSPDLTINLNKVVKTLMPADSIELQFQKIVFDKARVNYSDESQVGLKMIKIPQLSAVLEGFQYPQKSLLSDDHMFYADDVTLQMTKIQPVLTNGNYLFIEQVDFSKNDGRISIDTLSFNLADGATTTLFPDIEMVGLDFKAYLDERRLRLDSLKLVAANIVHDQSIGNQAQKPIGNTLPEKIDIGYFSSESTEIELKDRSQLKSYMMHKGSFEMHKFFADGDLRWDRFFDYAQYASISGQDFRAPLGDGYQIRVGQYQVEHPENTLRFNNISLTSQYSPAEYTSQLTYQKDWFDVNADDITFSGLDLKRALNHREYKASKVLVDGLSALIYRDKSVPLNTSVTKELPQGMLHNINNWIYLDTLQVKGDITHQLNPVNSEEIAELSFNSLNATVFQMTTVNSLNDQPMRLVSSGKLAGTANFKASAVFNMQDPNNSFSFSGQIDQMPLSALNKLLRPLANINIKDGYAERIEFTMKGNNEIASGEMIFRYNDLKIQILNPETNDMQGLNQEIKTFFANTFVIKQNNPTFLVLRPGTIFQRRDPSRVIFHYWGEALLSGAVSSIGINKSKKDEKRYDKELEAENR